MCRCSGPWGSCLMKCILSRQEYCKTRWCLREQKNFFSYHIHVIEGLVADSIFRLHFCSKTKCKPVEEKTQRCSVTKLKMTHAKNSDVFEQNEKKNQQFKIQHTYM